MDITIFELLLMTGVFQDFCDGLLGIKDNINLKLVEAIEGGKGHCQTRLLRLLYGIRSGTSMVMYWDGLSQIAFSLERRPKQGHEWT